MSKRYPPIFNVILFAVAVCVILANPMTMPMPWISAVTSFIVFAISSIFNAAVDAYNRYTIFAIHIVIIMLYAKQLFGKEAKLRYQTAVDALESYTPTSSDKLISVNEIYTCNALEDHIAPLYIKTFLVLFIIVFNIVYPKFYQFTILQALSKACNNSIDNTFMLSISPLLVIMLVLIPIVIGCILANIKANRMLNKMLHIRPLCS